jgi:hypothetical protein
MRQPTRMRRHRRRRHGEGTAWLVADRVRHDYLCYWYAGTNDGHLVEQSRAGTAVDAVAWGRERTPRVRIRTGAARTYWAGTAPRPAGFVESWTTPDASGIGHRAWHGDTAGAGHVASRPHE